MKRNILLIACLFVCVLISTTTHAAITQSISGTFTVDGTIDTLQITLPYRPVDRHAQIVSTTVGDITQNQTTYLLTLQDLKTGTYSYTVTTRIPEMQTITPTVPYSLAFDAAVKDSKAIRAYTQNAAQGSTDFSKAVAIASTVKRDIFYSLDTITQEATQNADWVLANKRGVCDEISVLTIAMLRSAAIPCAYVQGVICDKTTCQNHAWLQIRTAQGEFPFDIVFGQFGYVDSAHIPFSIAANTVQLSPSFTYKGNGMITPGQIDVTYTIRDVIFAASPVNVSLQSPTSVPALSPIMINVTLTNTHDQIIASRIAVLSDGYALTPQKTITLLGSESQVIPFTIITPFANTMRVTITQDDVPLIKREIRIDKTLPRTDAPSGICLAKRGVTGQPLTITCDAKASKICIKDSCTYGTHAQEDVTLEQPGIIPIPVRIDDALNEFPVIVDSPSGATITTDLPPRVMTSDLPVVNITITPSGTLPLEHVTIKAGIFAKQVWQFNSIANPQSISIQLTRADVNAGWQTLSIQVESTAGTQTTDIPFTAIADSWWEHIALFFAHIVGR